MKNLEPRRENPTFPESLRSEGVAPEEQDAVWALLDEWKPGEPGVGFNEAVLARIRAEDGVEPRAAAGEGAGGWLQGFGAWIAGLGTVRGLGLAGALATVVFAAVLLRGPATPPEDANNGVASQEFSAQQVEMALEDLQMLDELYNAPEPQETQNKKI